MKSLVRRLTKAFPPLYRGINRLRGYRLHSAGAGLRYALLGGRGIHRYGAWAVPDGLLNSEAVVYSVGVGDDIGFDLALIERFGCEVFAFDPTPLAQAFVAGQALPPQFRFLPIGLADHDGEAAFFRPHGGDAYSFTAQPQRGDSHAEAIQRPVRRLASLMNELGHDRIDLLKLDIEGFEYGVIADLLASAARPACLLVEFHHFQLRQPAATRAAVDALDVAGYRRFWVSDLGTDYGFVRDDVFQALSAAQMAKA